MHDADHGVCVQDEFPVCASCRHLIKDCQCPVNDLVWQRSFDASLSFAQWLAGFEADEDGDYVDDVIHAPASRRLILIGLNSTKIV